MKSKLTLTIDEDLLSGVKNYARSEGVSLSQLVEQILRKIVEDDNPTSLLERWRGKLCAARRDED